MNYGPVYFYSSETVKMLALKRACKNLLIVPRGYKDDVAHSFLLSVIPLQFFNFFRTIAQPKAFQMSMTQMCNNSDSLHLLSLHMKLRAREEALEFHVHKATGIVIQFLGNLPRNLL